MHVNGLAISRNNMQIIVCVTSFRLLRFKCQDIYCLGTSKCHDQDILTLNQPIRLQHFDRGYMNVFSLHAIS